MSGRLRQLFSEERPVTLLGLVRVAVSSLLLWNTLKLARTLRDRGFFGDYFFLPLLPEAWVPNETGYATLLALKALGCVAGIVGVLPRAGLLSAAIIGLYVIACDRLQYHNNVYVTHLVAFLLAFTPCDRSFLLRNAWRRSAPRVASGHEPAARGPFWAVRLIQLQVSLVYLTSAAGKSFDPDWRGGEVMRLRFLQGVDVMRGRGYAVPEPIAELLGSPAFASLASKAAIASELFLAFGLLLPRTRVVALWMGVLFHLGIQIFAYVDLFTWLMLSAYVLYARPELRERSLCFAAGRPGWVAAALPYLDWLLRFRQHAVPSAGVPFARFQVVERDGHVKTGFSAWVALCRAVPLLFPLWLPAAVIDRISTARRRGARAADSANTAAD